MRINNKTHAGPGSHEYVVCTYIKLMDPSLNHMVRAVRSPRRVAFLASIIIERRPLDQLCLQRHTIAK